MKNLFIAAPALFSLEILNPAVWLTLAAGFGGLSALASGLYLLNDLRDRDEDRLHPLKKYRPVASGKVSVATAVVACVLLLCGGLLTLSLLPGHSLRVGIAYTGIMLLYTLFLRRVMVLDVIVIATGFVLRVLMGGEMIELPVSHWLLLCTFSLALYLGMIKRRQEISVLTAGEGEPGSRRVLMNYPPVAIIDGWISALSAMALLCYALYTVDPETVAKHHTEALIYTLPLVVFGIFRYQKLALTGRAGEDPATLVTTDTGIRLTLILWALTSGLILYLARV